MLEKQVKEATFNVLKSELQSLRVDVVSLLDSIKSVINRLDNISPIIQNLSTLNEMPVQESPRKTCTEQPSSSGGSTKMEAPLTQDHVDIANLFLKFFLSDEPTTRVKSSRIMRG